jgi:hypothetical protein
MAEHAGKRDVTAAAQQAFLLLRVGFTAAPILFGLDKFFNWTVHWPDYLAGWVNSVMPGSGQDFMYFVGVVEIVAGLTVAVAPLLGAPLVAAWLGGIIINLLTQPARVLRHRAPRLRPDARRADAGAARVRLSGNGRASGSSERPASAARARRGGLGPSADLPDERR